MLFQDPPDHAGLRNRSSSVGRGHGGIGNQA
jgi:hypothetical protein